MPAPFALLGLFLVFAFLTAESRRSQAQESHCLRDAMIVFDTSGSMQAREEQYQSRLDVARRAIQGVLPEVTAVRFIRLVFVGPKQLFLVASVDLEGDAAESQIASTLRKLETELQSDDYIVDAVLTIAEPDELDRRL